MDLLDNLVEYLAKQLNMVPGEDAFYHEMPDEPDTCFCLYEVKTTLDSPPQIDAISRRVRFVTRANGNSASNALAEQMWLALWHDAERDVDVPDGFITLRDGIVFVDLRGKPIWDKSDQRNRKYFCFEAVITTTK